VHIEEVGMGKLFTDEGGRMAFRIKRKIKLKRERGVGKK
jgi:hypothetical protein